MSDQAQGNKLYDAAVGFMVAEKSHSNAWEQVAQFVDERVKTGDSLINLRREFRIVEKQIRKDFGVNRLPGAWRSAKSHALNAVGKGIPLLQSDGTAYPKTDVGKLLRAAKHGLPVTPLERFAHYIEEANKCLLTLTGTDQVRAASKVLAWAAILEASGSPVGRVTTVAGTGS